MDALIQPKMSDFRSAFTNIKNRETVFPVLLHARFTAICSQYKAPISSQAIQTLIDYLCYNVGFKAMKLSSDDKILINLQTRQMHKLEDQKICQILEIIEESLSKEILLSSDDILNIIREVSLPKLSGTDILPAGIFLQHSSQPESGAPGLITPVDEEPESSVTEPKRE